MMVLAWIVFPLILAALSFGCGFLVEACVGRRLPGPLIAPVGFALLVVLTGIFTSRGETASLQRRRYRRRDCGAALSYRAGDRTSRRGLPESWSPDRWALAAALAVFAVYAAPVVLSGDPTFTGYIKLDDTATWLAFVDRVMDHGRDLSGLEPSSYQTTLAGQPAGRLPGRRLPAARGRRRADRDRRRLARPALHGDDGGAARPLPLLAGSAPGRVAARCARWSPSAPRSRPALRLQPLGRDQGGGGGAGDCRARRGRPRRR